MRGDLLRLLIARTGDQSEAEDLLQEIWVRLHAAETGPVANGRSYLYRAANNAFLNEKEHEKIVLKHLKKASNPVDHENPEYLMQMDEFHEKLKNAIASLPQKEREVYLLSRVEKKTYAEIAEITGLGVKAIERRMSKALLQLRDVLGKELKF